MKRHPINRGIPMSSAQILKIRIVGDEARAEALMNMIHDMDGVAQVEAMPLPDASPPAVCHIEVAVADARTAGRIRSFAAGAAMLMDAMAEFVDQPIDAPLREPETRREQARRWDAIPACGLLERSSSP